MQFNKDTLKKIVKYLLMLIVTTFAVLSVPKQIVAVQDAFLIGLTTASTFVVLDLVMPSICLNKH